MRFIHLTAETIEDKWPEIAEVLAPAIRVHTDTTMQDVYEGLQEGYFHLLECNGDEGKGLLVIRLFEEDGSTSCYASYLAGKFSNPRQMVKTMRELMANFEAHCRNSGVRILYIGGRDSWHRVFPDFTPADDVPGRLRKVL